MLQSWPGIQNAHNNPRTLLLEGFEEYPPVAAAADEDVFHVKIEVVKFWFGLCNTHRAGVPRCFPSCTRISSNSELYNAML